MPITMWLTRVIVATSIVSGCASPPAQYPSSAPSSLLNHPLPAFRRSTLDGSQFDSQALRGRPIVVKFFAEYCEPCKRTLPAVQRLSQEHTNIAFVGISEDDSAGTAERLRAAYGLTFPVVHDVQHVLSGRFRAVELPATFVTDSQAVVRWVGGPSQTDSELSQAIAAASQ